MKKHLLLILALLAFVLPARAATELLFNFTQNSNGTDRGTSFSNNANVTAVISNVTYGDTYNVTDYVSSLTNVSNAYYNSKGGLHLGPNGTVTVNLKKTYKVTGYEVMGPTTTQHSIVNTSATVTVNGHTYSGVNAAGSDNWNRVQYEPTATENVSSFTIKAVNTDVYVKSIHIYLEAESDFTAPKFVPNGGRVKKGQTITVVNCEPSRLPQMDVTYGSNNVANHTGDFTFTFEETGTFDCWATAHSSTWSDYSETTEVSFEVYEDTPTPATLSVNPVSGTYKYPQTVTITSSKSDDEFSVLLKNQNVTLVDNNFTGSWTYTFPGLGTYTLYAFNNDDSEINETYIITGDPCPLTITPANTNITTGTEIKVASSVADATLMVEITKDGTTFVEEDLFDNPYTFTPTEPGTYVVSATASATGYEDSNKSATYTVAAPVITPVAPKISFSHEDQKVFGSEEEIDVTLSLNSDVYPVPDVIYYTLDGFMAHNTLETGNPGATPAGHVLEAAVDPTSLSTVVRIERSHREALQHQAVTINAYAFNTAGNDVAAATYIFNDNAKPAPDPEPTTITATVTMANQGWTSGQSPYTNATTVVNWTSKLADGSEGPNFSTKATAGGPKYYSSSNGTLSIYSGNVVYVTAPEGYVFVSAKANFSNGALQMKPESVKEYTAATSDKEMVFASQENAMRLRVESGSNAQIKTIEYVLTKTNSAAAATAAAPATIKTATGDVYNLVTDASQIKAGDQIIIASHYYKTGGSADDNHYVLKSVSTKGTGVKNTSLNTDNSKLTESADCLVFTVEADGTKDSNTAYLLKNGNNYLSGKNNNNGLSLGSKANISYCTITNGESGWGDNAMNVHFYNCGTGGNLMCYTGTTFNAYKSTSCSNRSAINDQYSNVILYRKSTGGPTVEAPVISLSEHANTTEPVTVTINCATDGATINYTVTKDGTTVADNLPYDAANKPVYSAVGSYTVDATATLGTASANATQVSFEITEPEKPSVATPEITLSTQAKPSDPVTVTIDCATEGATVTYTVKKDGTTVADNLTYDPANKPVFSEVGSYTVNATASKEGMNPANAAPANFIIEKLVEVVEELFFVMDQNLWDVDGAYPETVVPFVYDRENGWYDLDIASIPATGWRQTAEGWFEINGGFRGNFYVRDGKANRKGLVFGAAGTVANTTYATRAAADGNQLVEPGVEYNMYIAGEGDTHKVFTTIGDDTNSKAFSAGTIRVTHTPGNKDAAKPMTLQILANSDQTTGVDSITAEDAANDADARFFNLQGVEVPADRLAPGIYIRQAGSKATKVLVK